MTILIWMAALLAVGVDSDVGIGVETPAEQFTNAV